MLLLLITIPIALGVIILASSARKRGHYPPGPFPLPLIGNLHQLPKKNKWRKIKEWHDKYGPIITVHIGARPMIILGSYECVKDLLARRGATYSSRPSYFVDAVGSKRHTVSLPYGCRWRMHRRLLQKLLSNYKCHTYTETQDFECKQLLYELLSTNDFRTVFHRFATSLTFSLAYGKRLAHSFDTEVQEVEEVMREILEEAWLPNVAFPFLNRLPNFLAPWRATSERLSRKQAQLFTTCFEQALLRPASSWSKQVSAHLFGHLDKSNWQEEAYVVGTAFEAGSDTTAFVLEVAVMACVLYPATVQRAQMELDTVVGSRMPELQDIPQLPYIMAFINEVLRWRPVVPGGIHHATSQDDEYKGYIIPINTTVTANHWSLEFDSQVFDDPWNFWPERWLGDNILPSSAFGFGRRICPGKTLAMNSLYLAISRLLWAFDFKCDQNSVPDPFDMSQGVSSRPEAHGGYCLPRSLKHRELIENDWVRGAGASQGIMGVSL